MERGETIRFYQNRIASPGSPGVNAKESYIPKNVAEQAVLGADANGLYLRQVSKVARELSEAKVFDASTVERETKTGAVLLANFGKDTFNGIKESARDPSLLADKQESFAGFRRRLAKSVYFSLKKMGMSDTDLVDAAKVDEKMPDALKGVGEDVSGLIISSPKIRECLEDVNIERNPNRENGEGYSSLNDRQKAVFESIEDAEEAIKKFRDSNKRDTVVRKESGTALNFLSTLRKELSRNYEKEWITDEIVGFMGDYLVRKDATVGSDGELMCSTAVETFDPYTRKRTVTGNDAFEKDPSTGEYKNPELVEWVRDRESKATDLLMICTGGEFGSVEEINDVIKNAGINSTYTREDGSIGEIDDLQNLKDTLGFCFHEAIIDSKSEPNKKILGTLNLRKVDRLLPVTLDGIGENVVVNVIKDPFLREQLRTICLLDSKQEFTLLATEGGFGSLEKKRELKIEIGKIVGKITSDKRMGSPEHLDYTNEARKIQTWLSERIKIYDKVIEMQEKVGRGAGLFFSSEKTEQGKENRLTVARELLDYVRDSGSPPGSLNIMDQCTKLFEMTLALGVEDEIKTEIQSRLKLAFMKYHMHAAGGLLNNRGQSIEDSHEQGYKEGMLIDRKAAEFFWNGDSNGLAVGESWDRIEDMNFGDTYFRTLMRMVGIGFEMDETGKRAKVVQKVDTKGDDAITKNKSIDLEATRRILRFDELTVDSEAGKFLLSIKKIGCSYLGRKESDFVDDSAYLAAWNDSEIRWNFVQEFCKIQNPESAYWGLGSENPTNFNLFTDVDEARKEMVMEWTLSEIKKEREAYNATVSPEERKRTDRYSLETGYKLADDLLEATGESSVFNPCFVGHNDFSELILWEANMKDRKKKMKTNAPNIIQSNIATMFTTWPRQITGDGPPEKNYSRKGLFEPLHVSEIKTEQMRLPKSESYFLMTAILAKKVEVVQQALMAETYKNKETATAESFLKIYDAISKTVNYTPELLRKGVDKVIRLTKENKEAINYTLRKLYVQGVLEKAVLPESGWTWADIYLFISTAIRTRLQVPSYGGTAGKINSFISAEDGISLFRDEALKKGMENSIEFKRMMSELENLAKPVDIGKVNLFGK